MGVLGNVMSDFMTVDPRRNGWFTTRAPASFWAKKGRQRAMDIFRSASRDVAAYRDFLAAQGVEASRVRTHEDFVKLPTIDKRSYLLANQARIETMCLGGSLRASHSIARSSGFSGDPIYWPRLERQDEMAKRSAEALYVNFWDMDRISTLVVICFDLGMWITGEMSAHASRNIAMKDYPITITTPGSNLEDALEVVQHLGPRFDQVAILGYPPFLKQMFDLGDQRGVDWKALNVVLMPSGEGFSEPWRTHMLDRIGKPDDVRAIIGLFGMSEGAVVGYETPLSVFARRRAQSDPSLCRDLFGRDSNSYGLVQYSPMGTYLEHMDGEMVMTSGGALPLVRYNTHEQGGLLDAATFMEILASHGCTDSVLREGGVGPGDMWSLPFFFSFGRQDCVSVDGANIYVEGLEPALLREGMDGIRDWKIAVSESEDHGLKFVVLVEMVPGLTVDESLDGAAGRKRHYKDVFLNQLLDCNPDFASAYKNNPQVMEPEVMLYEAGSGPFMATGKVKQRHVHTGDL